MTPSDDFYCEEALSGRTPVEDTITETYSLLTIGQPKGVGDGLPKGANGYGADTEGNASTTAFPFLGNPN